MTQDEEFKAWWFNEGSQAPYTHHDCEEHTMRMCEIAWANGAYKEREACAKLIDDIEARCIAEDVDDQPLKEVAAAIRARGEA
jgi:hypothetical protein